MSEPLTSSHAGESRSIRDSCSMAGYRAWRQGRQGVGGVRDEHGASNARIEGGAFPWGQRGASEGISGGIETQDTGGSLVTSEVRAAAGHGQPLAPPTPPWLTAGPLGGREESVHTGSGGGGGGRAQSRARREGPQVLESRCGEEPGAAPGCSQSPSSRLGLWLDLPGRGHYLRL